MFGFLKRKKEKSTLPQLSDLNNQPLQEGDLVEAFRYSLGQCRLIIDENTYYYVSIENNEKVSWLKMIDASSDNQKVKKIVND